MNSSRRGRQTGSVDWRPSWKNNENCKQIRTNRQGHLDFMGQETDSCCLYSIVYLKYEV